MTVDADTSSNPYFNFAQCIILYEGRLNTMKPLKVKKCSYTPQSLCEGFIRPQLCALKRSK